MLTVYTMDNCVQWDSVVRSFSDYDIYYLSQYVRAFALHGDGVPLMFYYEGNEARGINVVMKRDVADDVHFQGKIEHGLYFDFSTPYGYGGWIVEGEDSAGLFDEYQRWCKENRIICEFTRFHPVLKNHVYSEDAYNVIPLGETVTVDLSSPEMIWNNLTSKNRNVIRKAIKNGVRIYNGRSEELLKEFQDIYNLTMDRDNAKDYYYFDSDFYNSILNDLPYNAQVFYAKDSGGKIIAASIMLMANGKLNYHLSGSLREYSSLAPGNLLLYEAACWGSMNGCKTFHLGGGVGSAQDKLFAFKKAFYRGELTRFHIGKKIHIQEEYDRLMEMRNLAEETTFFPGYRA